MHDELYDRDRHGEQSRERTDRTSETPGPLADREVPLSPIATSDVINRWLDGELPEPVGQRGEAARTVEFWRRLGQESERRRRTVTPPHVAANIMAAIAELDTLPAAAPWWRKDVQIRSANMIVLALGAFALGVLVTRLLAK